MGRYWRRFGTGLCFVGFAGLAWLGSISVLPLINRLSRDPEQGRRRVRRLVSAAFRGLLVVIRWLRVGTVHVEGRQWLAEADGCVVVANHPMYLDMVALAGCLPRATCVVKAAMQRNRWYRHFAIATGYVANDEPTAFLEACARVLERREPLIMFPQGTRCRPGEAMRFRRGAAQVAVRTGCRILPVVIDCQPLALSSGQAWYDVADRPWRLSITFHRPEPLACWGYRAGRPTAIAARDVTRALEDFFTRKLATHECTDGRDQAAHHRGA